MRAKDLHCGRGSSPLRTKFKTPKSNKSRSSSPFKKSNHKVEYFMDNGVININTPAKDEDFERESSPKTRIISNLQGTNSSAKDFQRRCKIISEDSLEKNTPQKTSIETKHQQRVSQFKRVDHSPLRNIASREKKQTPNLRKSRIERKMSINKSISKTRENSSALRSARSSNGLRENSKMAEVQRRKEEIFRKRHEELTAKLQKKEERRRKLKNQSGYTPKQGEVSPVKFEQNHDLREEELEDQEI
mmetsp:Transcript_12031/g.10631  ORF Transcript_12031/g.10631 Transcript_12031/m.10631 type:complete len:246 (+) Transcript_12031:128-865(+)